MMREESTTNPWLAAAGGSFGSGWRMLECHSDCESQTEALGAALAALLPAGATVCLTGDLGTGKTVFARGFAHGLGITEPVTSPTFTLVNSYEGRAADGGSRLLHHFDLYRIADPMELDDIGWEEYFDGQAVCLVEWPDRAGDRLPVGRYGVTVLRTERDEAGRSIRLVREGEVA